jgi:sister-chromatid-cohesion protein PDS5
MGILVPQTQGMILRGSPKEAKEAVKCLWVNSRPPARVGAFAEVVEGLKAALDPSSPHYRTAIVALGHVALSMPEEFKGEMKTVVSQKLVKELLVNPSRTEEDRVKNGEEWCEEEELPEITRAMIAGMKATVRWLIGLRTDYKSAAKTYKMLIAFVETGGGFINAKVGSALSWVSI